MKSGASRTICLVLACWLFIPMIGVNASRSYAQRSSPSTAQGERTIPDAGIIVFDCDMGAILESKLLKPFLVGLEPKSVKIDDDDLRWMLKTKRISGVIGIPKDIASLEKRRAATVDFLVSVQFYNSKTLKESYKLTTENLKPIDLGGKEVFGDSEGLVFIHKKNSRILEFGTKIYLSQRKVFDVVPDELQGMWKRLPNAPLKIAVDSKNTKTLLPLIEKEFYSKEHQPLVRRLMAAIENSKSIILLGNPNKSVVVNMMSQPAADGSVEKIVEGFDDIKQWAQTMVGNSTPSEESLLPTFRPFVDGIECGIKNGWATFELNKPKEIDEIVKKFASLRDQKEKKAATIYRFRQAMIAAHTFETEYRKLPFNANDGHRRAKFGNISWRVLALDQFGGNKNNAKFPSPQQKLFKQFDLRQDWDSAKNKPLAAKTTFPFGTGDKTDVCWVKTFNNEFSTISIGDGASNTIALIQNPRPVDWTEPKDLTPDEVVEIVKNLPEGKQIVAVFYDGSAIWVSNKCDIQTLRNALDPRDGKTVELRKLTITPKEAARYPRQIKEAKKQIADGQFETAIKTLNAIVAYDTTTQFKVHELLIRCYIGLGKILDAKFNSKSRKMVEQRISYGFAITKNLKHCMELDSERLDISHLVASYAVEVGNDSGNRVLLVRASYAFNELLSSESYCEKNPALVEEALEHFDLLSDQIAQLGFRKCIAQRLLSKSKLDLEPEDWKRNLANVTRYYLLIDNPESANTFLLEKKKQLEGSTKLASDNRAMESWKKAMASVRRYRDREQNKND